MSYKIATITPFRKEAKKLIKKYPSFKVSWLNWAADFPLILLLVLLSAITAIKYVWPSLRKEKVNPAGLG